MKHHTYHDLCVEILYRLQEDRNIISENNKFKINEYNYNVSIYLKLIPNLLNEALMLLATAGKYINKSYDIFIQPCKNISKIKNDLSHTYSEYDLMFADEINSVYCEFMGSHTPKIFLSDGTEYEHTSLEKQYKTEAMYNTDDPITQIKILKNEPKTKNSVSTKKIDKINFKADFSTFRIKTLALYKENFNKVELIYEYTPFKKIDLKEVLPDFYKLNETNIFVESKANLVTYKNTRNYSWEDQYNLIIDNTTQAIWRINYFSYPVELHPSGASDEITIIEVSPEVYPLLILYIEAKIRFVREMDYSANLLNEFEQKRQELINGQILKNGVYNYFEDVRGWL